MNKVFLKNIMSISTFLIVIILISSSSMSVKQSNLTEVRNSILEITKEKTLIAVETSTGLAPIIANKNRNLQTNSVPLEQGMWGYIANSSTYDEGTCYFYFDDPGSIEYFQETESEDFLSGGTGTSEETWLAVEYGNGALWVIDHMTGDMTLIGGGGASLNGLTWDLVYNRLYGASGSKLYEIDPETGEQEFIGSFGSGVNEMIAIASNLDGKMYGWDLGDKLWYIDVETGETSEIGSLGIDLNYAQDGAIDWETNELWLTAYTISPNYGSYLYICDMETGECTLIGQFEGNSQITASFASFGCPCPPSDVGVKNIINPVSGHAVENIPMQVLVKNYGYNTETFDVQMKVNKFEKGPVLFDEDFSGSFPPDGWTTDFWNQSFTNVAGGESPEARVYKYDQKNGSQYYDNYIMSPPINATGWEKVTIAFRWATNMHYPQYCNFYIKYRKNEISPWKDVTPWDNPLNVNYAGELYTINCYGFDGDMGDGFQVMFQYVGYYYYYNYFYLDDVEFTAFNSIEEYNEVVEDVELVPGEEEIVDFPTWTPPNWQDPDYEDTWQDFFVKACTLLKDDDYPDNDCKKEIVNIYFPWLHDIEITSIDSPCEDGPGKTYPVQATIKNVGQYAECCIPINIKIGESVVLDKLLYEDDWPGSYYYPGQSNGWQDEHKKIAYYYGWEKSNTSYSGGKSPEAILRYYRAKPDHVFYSYSINTSDYSSCRLEFKSYINHYTGSGLYALEAGYSHDGDIWYALWHEEPESNKQYNVECAFEGGFETTYIGFWVKGNPYYFNYWYIDDISVKALDFVSEYSDNACQGDDLEPGESRTFEFDDWTPDYLEYETTGLKDYIANAEIHMFGDKNTDNDIKSIYFTLDYWHDPAIADTAGDPYLWNNGEPDGRNGLPSSMYKGYSNMVIDDFYNPTGWNVTGGHFRFVWDSGDGPGNVQSLNIEFFQNEELGDCEPSETEYVTRSATEWTEWLTGDTYFSRPEVACTFEMDEVLLEPGDWWVGIQPDGVTENMAYILTTEGQDCETYWEGEYWGYSKWRSSGSQWGTDYDVCYALIGQAYGPPGITEYIQPGTEPVFAQAINLGTFEEHDLRCDAEIWEFITDPINGTLQYTDNITDIDLTEPLGGMIDLNFDDFTYANEGRYGVYFDMPGLPGRDDFPKNNELILGIGVDDTKPVSSHILDPPTPDGENGWYVSDLEVTLVAYDPSVADVSSGVKEIKYEIDGGGVQTIDGASGSFLITQEHDGHDVLVEYWAIDNVDNVESKNSFTIDMDQTNPPIDLTYEVVSGNPTQGWLLEFTATATDATSGMDRVEFFLNAIWQETVTGSGPTYQWSFIYHGDLSIDVRADSYDIAGNMANDIIENPVSYTFNQNAQQQSQSQMNPIFINNKTSQRLYVIYEGGYK